MSGDTCLLLEEVHAGYGLVPVLMGCSLRVKKGEVLGILGHNGMGKTTLLRTIMGFVRVGSGEMTWNGVNLRRKAVHERVPLGIGYVAQGRGIIPSLTAYENLQFAIIAGGKRSAPLEQTLDYFPRLKPLLNRPGGGLSGGEQQLLALARSLTQGPELLLLDEPTEGVQPSIREEIVEAILRVRDSQNTTLVLVEQNLRALRQASDRVALFYKGTVRKMVEPHMLDDIKLEEI